jgi:hypothetical protein
VPVEEKKERRRKMCRRRWEKSQKKAVFKVGDFFDI